DGVSQADICAVYHHVALDVQKANLAGAHFKVGGAAETLGAQVPGTTALVEYAAKNNLHLDFVSWHCYNDVSNGEPRGARDLALRIQGMLDSHHKGDIPQLITEWNCTTWDRGKSAQVLANQGAWLAAGWSGCVETGLGENLVPMPFCINSYVGDYQSIVAPTGTNYADGKVFPEYNVYKMMSMQKTTRIEASSGDGDTYPMASMGDDGSVALMVSRPASSGLSTKITFANLPRQFAAGAYSVDRYLVDETHSNYMHDNANDKLQKIGSEKVAAGSSYSTTVTLGANAVIMFVLTPVPPASARSRPDRGVLLGEGVRLDAKTQIETSGAKAVVEPDGQAVSVVFPAAKGEQWLAIKPPVGLCDLTVATEVHVKLKNVGTAPITPSVQVASVRGPTDTVAPGPLAVGEEREIVVSFIPALPGRGEPVARPASPGDQRQAEYTFNSDAAGPVLITARHD